MKSTEIEKAEHRAYLQELAKNPYVLRMKCFVHHRKFRTYDHVMKVAYEAIKIAEKHPEGIDFHSLIRGAVLHDYYLYNWRDRELWHYHHIKKHPHIAFVNACRDFGNLNDIEKDIILHHMFPHPPVAPKTKEGWIVVKADKIVSVKEYMERAPKIHEPVDEQKKALANYDLSFPH